MVLEMNTLAAFDKSGKVVKTWNYELVCSQERAFANVRSKCDEKGYTLRVCFNDDKEVEAYSQLQLQKQLKDFSE
jgi:hypothetical protein